MNDGAAKQARDFRVHRYDATGPFATPVENTWAAHDQLIRAFRGELDFNCDRYDYFDGIIAARLGNPALTDSALPDYPRYDAMRGNIAVLRNFILSHYESKGECADPDRCQERLQSIAESLGQALANDTWGTRAFTRSTSVDIANIDGVGAMEMYKHLLELQEKPTSRQPLISNLRSFLALPDRDWGLPQLAESPFHPSALAAPPPGFVGMPVARPEDGGGSDTDMQQRDPENRLLTTGQSSSTEERDPVAGSIAVTEQIVRTARRLYTLDTLADIPREESIEEARRILRHLRNMAFTDRSMEEFLEAGTPVTVAVKKQAFSRLADIFAAHLKHAQSGNPAITRTSPAVAQARDTVAAMALELAEHTRRMLHDDDEREQRLNQLIDSLPQAAELHMTQPVERILETFELGLELACGRELTSTSLERLSTAAGRLEQHSILLQHPEQDAHMQEESLELARSMLGRMAQLPLADRTLADFVEHAPAAEQAAFAQQLEALVCVYRNLLLEAAQNNPEIVQDLRVKEANDAVGGFAHAVKLMAAKEMPNSIASAQQISAEAAREPGQWKDLSHHAVNRLIKSAEGGLEKAIGEMAQDAEEQEEDLAQEFVEAALLHTDQGRRRKRRRGESKSRAGRGMKKQMKKLLDFSADDRFLKQGRFAEERTGERDRSAPGSGVAAARAAGLTRQIKTVMALQADDRLLGEGRFADENPVSALAAAKQAANPRSQQNAGTRGSRPAHAPVPPKGLKEADLAAISKLGSSLRDISSQLQGVSVTDTEKRTPDNRTAPPDRPPQKGPGKGY